MEDNEKNSITTDIDDKELLKSSITIDIDDKELLKSRINQQSELICILKKRADEYMLKYNAKEEEFVILDKEHGKLTTLYDEEQQRSNALENTYFNLGKVHQDLIAAQENLNVEIERLKTECEVLTQDKLKFSNECANKDAKINSLKECISSKEREIMHLKEQQKEFIEQSNARQASIESAMTSVKEDLINEIKRLSDELVNANCQITEADSKLQNYEKVEKEMESQLSTAMNMYTNEKKRCMELEEKSHKRVDKALANENQMLQQTIIELEEKQKIALSQFHAYKEYADELLNKEKSLNSKLRKLRSPDCFTQSDTVLQTNYK